MKKTLGENNNIKIETKPPLIQTKKEGSVKKVVQEQPSGQLMRSA